MSGGVWIASYVLLWMAVVVLSLAVVVLLRQIGVLHARLRPQGVHFAGEGPVRGQPAPPVGVDFAEPGPGGLTLLVFTSPTCELCAALLPSLRMLERRLRAVSVSVVEHSPATAPAFRAYNVSSTPYVVAVDAAAVVRGGGVANTLEQVEVLLDAVAGELQGQEQPA